MNTSQSSTRDSEKKYKILNSVGKKTVRCKKTSENVKDGSKWCVSFYKYLSQTFYDSSCWLVIFPILFWNGIVRGTVLIAYANYIYIIPHFIFTSIWMPCAQKIFKNLTQVNHSGLPYSFRRFVLKTSHLQKHTIMIFPPRSWKLANSSFYGINKIK